LRTDDDLLEKVLKVTNSTVADEPSSYGMTDNEAGMLHYMLWSGDGDHLGVSSYKESFKRWISNPSGARDLAEVIEWRRGQRPYPTFAADLPFACNLKIHAAYGLREITAAFGKANLATTGPAGTGVVHLEQQRAYLHLVTFRKEERDFAPATRYKDYPVSPTILHWESQSGTAQTHTTGQNYINFRDRDYTILFFARIEKRVGDEPAPYVFLGPAKDLLSYNGNNPIQMLWELEHAMPADLYEQGRTA
jgi:hypothetical protein